MMILVDKTTIEHGLGKLVEHVRCFVQPAALMTRRRQRLVEGVPKAKRAIADGQLRRDRQTSRLQIDEQFPPALRTLPHACLEADQFLDALGRRADQNQHACMDAPVRARCFRTTWSA
jgi:hypothetical protein